MSIAINLIITIIALLHIYFMILEMFFWTKPLGMKVFGTKPDDAKNSAILAANQGLYNGFLAAGLIWGLLSPNPLIAYQVKIFFSSCVFIAGIYGWYSTKAIKIMWVQAMPALLGLILLILKN